MTQLFQPPLPPASESELLSRAQSLAGATFGELADCAGIPVPPDLRRDKGWVGMNTGWAQMQAVRQSRILLTSG